MATCPVCGMSVDEKTAPAQAMYQGKLYYFCSTDCKKQFDQQPAQAAQPARPQPYQPQPYQPQAAQPQAAQPAMPQPYKPQPFQPATAAA